MINLLDVLARRVGLDGAGAGTLLVVFVVTCAVSLAMVTFFVGVQDVAATLDAAVAQGGTIIQPATSVPGVTFGLLADPQGQVVGLASADS